MRGKQGTFFTTILIVEGSGAFPIDMLRYDRCVPFDERDSYAITDEDSDTTRRVWLIRYAIEEQRLTPDRWKSFTWRVVAEGRDEYELEHYRQPSNPGKEPA
jgi:hypothetical protein